MDFLEGIDSGWLWTIGGVLLLIAEIIAPGVFLVWIGIVVALDPLCRWFAALKERRRGAWWIGYL